MKKFFLFSHTSTAADRRSHYLGLQLMLAIASLFVTLLMVTFFSAAKYDYEERVGSFFWTLFPDTTAEERITIIAIDEESLSEVGPWPWPRETMAKLSDQLAEYNTSLQLYDIVFPEPKDGDDILRDSLLRHNAIVAQIPILDADQTIRSGTMSSALDYTRCQSPIPATSNYLANSSILNEVKKGHITPIIDNDGAVRKQPPVICVEGQAYPSLALQGLLSQMQKKPNSRSASVSLVDDSRPLSSAWKLVINSYFGLSIPVDANGNMRLSYRQAPDVFQVVSASKVLNGTAPASLLEGSWALVGATAFGLGDVVPTPYSGSAPGVELQARLLSNLLDGTTPYTPSGSAYFIALEILLATLLLIMISRRGEKVSSIGLPVATITVPLMMLGIHAYLLSHSIWLGWVVSALYALIFGALLVLTEHAIIRDERHRILHHLTSYLPKSVAQHLVRSLPSGAIEAHRSELVILSADLRNFSAYEESRPPEEAAALLHCFFVNATEIVESFGGQLEEYTGDAILASWSTNHSNLATLHALEASMKLQSTMEEILPKSAPLGLEPLALGIGIERGSTLVGSIGPVHRRSHTLLGDTVTIALRIQEMTQDLAQPILIGECAARDLHGEKLESQGSFLLDGLRTPHVLFAPRVSASQQTNIGSSDISLRLVKSTRH